MISPADFQPLSIGKINIFQQQPRFYSQICIVSKSMLVKRSRFVDTLRDAATSCRLTSFIEYLNYVHYSIKATILDKINGTSGPPLPPFQ